MSGLNKKGSLKRNVIVVMPAYNAEATLEKTFRDIPAEAVDKIILTDDASSDRTVAIARNLGVSVICHDRNKGYGANQKTCYDAALKEGATHVVMIHMRWGLSIWMFVTL